MHNLLKLKRFYLIRCYCNRIINTQTEKQFKPKRCLVPKTPVSSKIELNKLPPPTKIDATTIALLERLSLVDCANRRSIETLEEAISFADQIQQLNTEGVEPLVTVLEDKPLQVEDDVVLQENSRRDILKNSAITEDEYFVAPPGNIPLEPRDNLLHEKEKQ